MALPPLPLQHDEPFEKEGVLLIFCILLLPGTERRGDLICLNKGVPTAQERRTPGEKIQKGNRSAWFKNILRFAARARTT